METDFHMKYDDDGYFSSIRNTYQTVQNEEIIVKISKYLVRYIKDNKLESDFRELTYFEKEKISFILCNEGCCCCANYYGCCALVTCCIGWICFCKILNEVDEKYEFSFPYKYEFNERERLRQNAPKNHWQYLRFWHCDNLFNIFECKRTYILSTIHEGFDETTEGYDKFIMDKIKENLERIKFTTYNLLKYGEVEGINLI
jgi:hypothetical protein